MLTVKDIVDSIAAAYLYWVDLVQIEILNGLFNLRLLQWPLVLLIGNKVLNRDLFKVDIRYKSAQVLHECTSRISESISDTFSCSDSSTASSLCFASMETSFIFA